MAEVVDLTHSDGDQDLPSISNTSAKSQRRTLRARNNKADQYETALVKPDKDGSLKQSESTATQHLESKQHNQSNMQSLVGKNVSWSGSQFKVPHGKSKSLVPVPVALKCPGCKYQTEWRHDYAMHLSKCDQARSIIQPQTPGQYLAQFLKIPTNQANMVVAQQFTSPTRTNTAYSDKRFKQNANLPLRHILHKQKDLLPPPPSYSEHVSTVRHTMPLPPRLQQNPQIPLRSNPQTGVQHQQPKYLVPSEVPVDLSISPVEKKKPDQTVKAGAIKRKAKEPCSMPTKVRAPLVTLPPPTAPIFACTHCSFRTDMQEKMEVHIRKHEFVPPPKPHVPSQGNIVPVAMPIIPVPVPRTFTCNHCTFRTSSELCMVRHLLSKHRTQLLPRSKMTNNNNCKIFSCSFCNYLTTEAKMVDHMLHHYKNHPPCGSCSSCQNWQHPFHNSKPKNVQVIQKPPKDPSPKKTESIPTSLAKTQQSNSLILCTFCGKQFPVQGLLQAHILAEHMNVGPIIAIRQNNHEDTSSKTTPDMQSKNNNLMVPVTKTGGALQENSPSSKTCSLPTPPSSDGEYNEASDVAESSYVPTVVFDTMSTSSDGSTNEPFKLPEPVKKLAEVCTISVGETTKRAPDTKTGSDSSKTEATSCKSVHAPLPVARLAVSKVSITDTESADPYEYDNSDDAYSPTRKKVKLGLKIFRNLSGEYQAQQIVGAKPEAVKASESLSFGIINQTQQYTNILNHKSALPAMDYQRMSQEIHHSLAAADKGCDDKVQTARIQGPARKPPRKVIAAKKAQTNRKFAGNQKNKTSSDRRTSKFPNNDDQTDLRIQQPQASCPMNNNNNRDEIKHVDDKQRKVSGGNGNSNSRTPTHELEMEVDLCSDGEKTCTEGGHTQANARKKMAELLRSKLANIDLKTKGRQPTERTPSPVKMTFIDVAGKSDEVSMKPGADFEPDECIDLTLEDTDDEPEPDHSHKAENVGINCRVNIQRLKSEDIKQELADANIADEQTSLPAPSSSDPTSDFENKLPELRQVNTLSKCAIATMTSSKHSTGPKKLKTSVAAIPDVKSIKKSKAVRRRDKFLATPARLASSSCSVSTLDEEDMVICPYCPKRLLYRLLPAHVQFHGSDCEHRCRECDFATSFKWVLDTHISCHKDSQTDARQISEDEWLKIKHGMNYDDEDIELTQKLIIKDATCVLPTTPTKQTARKTASKKSTAVNMASIQPRKSNINAEDNVQQVAVNIRQAVCTNDLFNLMISDVRKKS